MKIAEIKLSNQRGSFVLKNFTFDSISLVSLIINQIIRASMKGINKSLPKTKITIKAKNIMKAAAILTILIRVLFFKIERLVISK